MANTTISLQSFTKLPVEEFLIPNKVGTAAIITTPHKGKVIINYEKGILKGWLFFSHIENEKKLASEIINQVVNLEIEAKEFLLKEWLKTIK